MNIWSWLAGGGTEEVTSLRFEFNVPLSFWLSIIAILGCGALAWELTRRSLKTLQPRMRTGLAALRALVVVLACFLALQPTLVGYRFDPARSFLLMLYDNSSSMSIGGEEDQTRGDRLQAALIESKENFTDRLAKRYQIARYAYGNRTRRIQSEDMLEFNQTESNHGNALESVLRDFRGIDVAAVILFSDGIDQPGDMPMPRDLPVPVITVSIGESSNWRDLALERVSFSRSHGDKRPVKVKTGITTTGLQGRRAIIEVLQGERVVTSRTLEIASDLEDHEVRLEFKPEQTGWIQYTARARLEPLASFGNDPEQSLGDKAPENNQRHFLVDNREKLWKVLYFAGRPNWENKYIQRALSEDKELDLTSVIRISPAETKFVYRGKKSSLVNPLFEGFANNQEEQPRYDESVFLRFGGRPEEAGKGFPGELDELFAYDLVIIGDVEARFFSQGQAEMIREYVRKRGGNLLMLGGPHSFSEGGYQGTVLEGLLPVLLENQRDAETETEPKAFKATPTVEGLLAGSWAFDANPERNRELWQNLPDLFGLNHFPMTRAGATVMARVEAGDENMKEAPLFAVQRYGEGRSAILATGATWLWHMQTDKDDNRHARFWRQLTRSLIWDTPEQVLMRNKEDQYPLNSEVNLEIIVRDDRFSEMPGMQSRWMASAPDGSATRLAVDESLQESGLYTGLFRARQPGVYNFDVQITNQEGALIGTLEEAVLVEADLREYRRTLSNALFLEELAAANGGSAFKLDQLAEIPDKIPWKKDRRAEEIRFPIWHFPGFFILLVLLFIPEWYLRRTRGYA